MLAELCIKNLAVIEELRLALGPGLTVLSGEEGAGKSLLVDALCLLLGGRASTSLVRSQASRALVEGVFWTPQEDSRLAAAVQEAGLQPESDGSLIMSREVQEQGRSTARVNGRAVPLSLLRELGGRLMDINSQMEHLSLLNPQRQLDLLDAYGGLLEARSRLGDLLSDLREASRKLKSSVDGTSVRQQELLAYQLAEIEAAKIQPDEDQALRREAELLQRAQALQEGCMTAYNALYGEGLSATGLVHQAIKALRSMVSIDPSLDTHLQALTSSAAELEESARDIRCYAEGVEERADRLEQVEERLELLRRLKSKYGPTLQEVTASALGFQQELDALRANEEQHGQLEEERQRLEEEAGRQAEGLSKARQGLIADLTGLVNAELSDLGMPWAKFDIRLNQVQSEDGLPTSGGRFAFSQHGIDRVEFLGVTNPGEPLRPLAEIASGGETCRFMLALKVALRQADSMPTLVFDEIDMGVGGRSAHMVGRKLAALAQDRQVICITHLPQIACYGDRHYKVQKDVSSGRALTRVEHLEGRARVEELAAMLGGGDGAMLESAQELLRRAGDAASDP